MSTVSEANVWGPVLLEVVDSLARHRIDPSRQAEVETYWDIVFVAAHQHSTPEFHERSDPRLDSIARALDTQLDRGWLAGEFLQSPQSVYTASAELRKISARNPENWLLGDKPAGAFWTSSILPDGVSAWERTEWSEFPTLRREVKYFHFRLDEREYVYTIRNLSDYRELVTRYPRQVEEGRVAVDWVRVADDFVAVHLTASGLARVQCYRIDTGIGSAMLSGWDAESTAWLRLPSFAQVSEQTQVDGSVR